MAHQGFSGSSSPMSFKQCVLAKEMHYECLDDMKSENNYLCPDTWEGFKRWCPQEVRMRLALERKEYIFSRDVWAKNN